MSNYYKAKRQQIKHNITKNSRLDVFNTELVKGAKFSGNYEFPRLIQSNCIPEKAIPFNMAKSSNNFDRWVHFYIHDFIFERVWKTPKNYLPLFKKFQGVITPDFSLYRNMPLAMQIWNTYRNRAIGYWLQKNGIPIIANVRWGDERTYNFAFEGLEKGGTYAVGSHGCKQNKTDSFYFKKGLEKMVLALEPNTIVNYSYYSKDIFEKYEKQGILVITLDHWSSLIKRKV